VADRPFPDVPRVIAICSFCRHPDTDVQTLVAGPGVFICNECVELCAQIVAGKSSGGPQLAPWEYDLSLEDTLAQLAPVASAAAQVDRNLHGWVQKARALGASWARIGEALGISRQSAWERFAAAT
jgi:hypothetical protein